MSKLLLLDKDWTIIRPKSGGKFVQSPWDQEPYAGVAKRLKEYKTDDWTIVVCSNQGGVAAGHKSLENAMQEMRFCLELFPEIEECYFCPDFEGNKCVRYWRNDEEWADKTILYDLHSYQTKELDLQGKFRKPSPGMLLLAQHIHNPDDCLYVGDRPEDEKAADAAEIMFEWIDNWL